MSKVVVRLVQPAHLNGVRPGELVLNDLHDGLTVICAPNASGKSTLAEAIGLLFRPNERSGDFSVTGLIEVAGTDRKSVV